MEMESQTSGNTQPHKIFQSPGGRDAARVGSPSSPSSFRPNRQHKRNRSEDAIPDQLLIDDHFQPQVDLAGESNLNNKNEHPTELAKDFQTEATTTSVPSHITGNYNYSDAAAAAGSSNLNAEKDVDSLSQEDVEEVMMDDECLDDYDENEYDCYEYDDDGDNDNDNDNDDFSYDETKLGNYDNWAEKLVDMDFPPGEEATLPWLQNISDKIERKEASGALDAVKRYTDFKQFDTVNDYSDHIYAKEGSVGTSSAMKPSKDWAKRIQHEWMLLENDLPSSIVVRVYEERMDLLRAVIVGPAGTPYHDGLFFFDALFPLDYPSSPPKVHYHSGGLRLNPNLYNCGKVCLSLLGTWMGQGCEQWNSQTSSMLQVLLSIQALVLNEKPYFNEPGFVRSAGTPEGEKRSVAYNEEAFLLSCKTMLYTLRRPLKNFEDYVARHFRERGRTILIACLSYLKGSQVGCKLENTVPDVDIYDSSILQSPSKQTCRALYDDLLMEFTVKGADCDPFLAKKVKKTGAAYTADSGYKTDVCW